jgi:hypothetical protein
MSGVQQGAAGSENPYEPPKAEFARPSREEKGWFDRPVSDRPRPAPASEFSLDCQCGQVITIAGSQAGSMVTCACGALVKVPSLGRLRELSGKGRYESSICDTIKRMVASGELPAGGTCAVSGKPTVDVIELEVLVPRFFKTDEDPAKQMWMVGVWALLYIALFQRSQMEEDEEGATIVQAPLRVARRYQGRVRRMSQSRLHRLLRTVPEYGQLLDENPQSRISASASGSSI